MKKIISILILITSLFLFYGCAAESPWTEGVTIYSDLYFDFDSMTYTQTESNDMLYRTGNPFDDFIILYLKTGHEAFSTQEMIAYENLFLLLIEATQNNSLSVGTLLTYSSSELRDLFELKDIEITLDDIVAFNNIKQIVEDLKSTLASTDLIIPKITYIEERLDISLDDTMIEALDTTQYTFNELFDIDQSKPFKAYTLDELLLQFEDNGFNLDQETQDQISTAYPYIINLLTE